MKLGLEVQLDGHILHPCRREERVRLQFSVFLRKTSSLIKIQQTQSEPSRTLKHALYFNIYRLSAMFMQFGELVFLSCILTSGMSKLTFQLASEDVVGHRGLVFGGK